MLYQQWFRILDDIEDDILWAEQYNKSDEEGDDMYDDTWTDTTDIQWW